MTTTDYAPRQLVVPLSVEWRDSGNPDSPNETTLRGHAAVFNSLSEDLGGFRETIEPGAFRSALRKSPDVRLLLNHDPNFVLARTASNTLELREDALGLHVFARVDKNISWVSDLRSSMQRGDIDQMSFAFTMSEGGDDWEDTEQGPVRTIRADGVSELFDTSIVTYPAYERTAVTMRSDFEQAVRAGKLPGLNLPDVATESTSTTSPLAQAPWLTSGTSGTYAVRITGDASGIGTVSSSQPTGEDSASSTTSAGRDWQRRKAAAVARAKARSRS